MEKLHSILLESGTNEVELLVFEVGGEDFGINVAKVKEIVQVQNVRPMPLAHYYVKGTFILREKVHLLLDLRRALGKEESNTEPPYLVMVVEINAKVFGLLVDQVDSIHRLSWKDISPVPNILTSHSAPLTGMVNIGENVIQILDLESIITEVTGETVESIKRTEEVNVGNDEKDIRILIVEDSAMIRKAIKNAIYAAGYRNIEEAETGAKAWEMLEEIKKGNKEPFDAIITDVEMPEMDGLHLTARVKEDQSFKDTPVIIYSSIVSEENKKKGESVGADSQITKFDTEKLLKALSEQLSQKTNLDK